ncbi:MAG: C4-dicarboxylate ABC transporter substrate-binding protein [Spirochaetes bacterium]|nr:MAG: C4-dicarboxylate ABC transporter substrate-binding protein [Spirochaetota bacterium]
MKKMAKAILVIILITSMVPLLFAGGEKEAKEEKAKTYNWKFASAEVEEDFMTVFGKRFAEEMEKCSDGRIKITVYPFGTLGAERDIHELAQTNTVQFVFSDYGWIAGFVPQAQVWGLHYLWPREKSFEVFKEVVRNGKAVKLLEEKFREKNLQPLGYHTEGWMWWTSNKPLRRPEDLKGVKFRVMASKMLVTEYNALGASATPMDFGEVYSGLQLGLIDAQVNPLFIAYSMKFYEVQDYFTNPYESLFVAIPCMNKDAYDALPKETQDKIKQVWDDLLESSFEWAQQKSAEYKEIILKERPKSVFYEFSKEEMEPFEKIAKTVYSEYVKQGGSGAQEILDALLADIEAAKKKLGVK